MTYTLDIQLVGIDRPKVWRRIQISPEMSLFDLHMAIQTAMGWTASHPHCFADTNENGEIDILPTCDETGQSLEVRIKKHLSPNHPTLHYIYDFGDYWDHKITLHSVQREVTAIPDCIDGAGACPPENSGGPTGYLQAIANGSISLENAELFSVDKANDAITAAFLKTVIGN